MITKLVDDPNQSDLVNFLIKAVQKEQEQEPSS